MPGYQIPDTCAVAVRALGPMGFAFKRATSGNGLLQRLLQRAMWNASASASASITAQRSRHCLFSILLAPAGWP